MAVPTFLSDQQPCSLASPAEAHGAELRPGCRIDNLEQIGHNVELGKGCVIGATAGVSDSARLGDLAAVGGQAGIASHLTIGVGARSAARSGVKLACHWGRWRPGRRPCRSGSISGRSRH